MTSLESLAAKLAAAEGPLDMQTRAELLHACHCPKIRLAYPWKFSVSMGDAGEDELYICCQGWSRSYSAINQFPDTSIDAALTLVPEPRPQEITIKLYANGKATVQLKAWEYDTVLTDWRAPNIAISLCLASIRARIAHSGATKEQEGK